MWLLIVNQLAKLGLGRCLLDRKPSTHNHVSLSTTLCWLDASTGSTHFQNIFTHARLMSHIVDNIFFHNELILCCFVAHVDGSLLEWNNHDYIRQWLYLQKLAIIGCCIVKHSQCLQEGCEGNITVCNNVTAVISLLIRSIITVLSKHYGKE